MSNPAGEGSPFLAPVFKFILIATTIFLIILECFFVYRRRQTPFWIGLGDRAWKATFTERGLQPPPRGPREKMGMKELHFQQDSKEGSRESVHQLPGFLNVDTRGLQWAIQQHHPKARILIVGASVAFGTYSTTEPRTYFNQLVLHLKQQGWPVEVIVLATGGWVSYNELMAFRTTGLSLKPDIVIFLDGLNDITLPPQRTVEVCVENYLRHLKEARDMALAHHIQVVFMPQPFLPVKHVKSALEKDILKHPFSMLSIPDLIRAQDQERKGLEALTIPKKVFVLDCSQPFEQEDRTVFVDLWHFTDFGQALLAEFIAPRLEQILMTSGLAPN
jgi:lysophospholipase L1-like esterase